MDVTDRLLAVDGLNETRLGKTRVRKVGRRRVLGGLMGAMAAFTAAPAEAQMSPTDTSVPSPVEPASDEAGDNYTSPYSLRFTASDALLDAGFDQRPWDDPEAEATMPFAVWEEANAGRRGAAWGPPARQYPAPALPRTDPAYLRERVIAVAARHIGLAYQHHHVPSWDPPAGWPWLSVKAASNGPGLDCSNFTSFVFNYALGIKLPTAIGLQGQTVVLRGAGGADCLHAQPLPLGSFASLGATLAPADLIYIRNRAGRIGHVVMWLGQVGQDPKGDPLIIDCTETAHADADGVLIPIGVRLRPFREKGWYWRNASHGHRIIEAVSPVCEPPPPFPEGGDVS
jgi:cell wall-associated NlpC family hydrolase